MWFQNYYWYYSSAVPKRTCEYIMKYGRSLHQSKALIGGPTDPKKISPKERKMMDRKRWRASRLLGPTLWFRHE